MDVVDLRAANLAEIAQAVVFGRHMRGGWEATSHEISCLCIALN